VIFTWESAARILAGQKTVTRRRTGQTPARLGEHRNGRPLRYEAGSLYTVQTGRGKRHVGHILVNDVRLEPLTAALTKEEARREGFASPSEFMRTWLELHSSWVPGEVVARIEFELADDCIDCDAKQLLELAEATA